MKTSSTQFQTLVEFMESNGDLNKRVNGLRGRVEVLRKWHDLTKTLNNDSSGDRRSIDKWKKVWSDLKNNTKRKYSKIQNAALSQIRDPAFKLTLSKLERRVLNITGHPVITGLDNSKEAGVELSYIETPQDEGNTPSIHLISTEQTPQMFHIENLSEEPNSPGHSTRDERSSDGSSDASSSHADERRLLSPPPRRVFSRSRVFKRQSSVVGRRRRETRNSLADAYETSDKRWRHLFSDLASEHMRLRKRELRQQDRWQNLFERCIDCIENYFNK